MTTIEPNRRGGLHRLKDSTLVLLLSMAAVAIGRAQTLPLLPAQVDGITVFGQCGRIIGGSELRTENFLLGPGTGLRGAGVEFVFRGDKNSSAAGYEFEMAFGYEYETGFRLRSSSLDLRGAIVTLPSVSAYTGTTRSWRGLSPYVGVRTGFVQLWNVRAYNDTAQQFALEGSTFLLGASVGIEHNIGWILEVSVNSREVRSVDWKFPTGVTAVPAGGPRLLGLSEVSVALGYKVFRKKTA